MDIIGMIKDNLLKPEVLDKLGQTVGASPEQVRKVTDIGLPAILGGMTDNSQTQAGAESLARALEQHQDAPVDDTETFFDQVDQEDGGKILNHVLGSEQLRVESAITKKTGLDLQQVTGLLTQLAPLLLGALGRQKKEENLDVNDITGLLTRLTDQNDQNPACGLSSLLSKLDADQDGNFMDDVNTLFDKFRNR